MAIGGAFAIIVFHAAAHAFAADCNSDEPGEMIAGCSEVLRSEAATSIRAVAFLRRGAAYKDKREFTAAIADFAEALRLNPELTAALTLRGAAYAASGQPGPAFNDYSAVLQTDPNNADAVAGIKDLLGGKAPTATETARPRAHTSSGYLGIMHQRVTIEIAASLGLNRSGGAMVAGIHPGGPAAGSALRPGDVITEYEGTPIEQFWQFPVLVNQTPAEKTVALRIFRDGNEYHLPLTTVARDPGQQSPEIGPYCHVEPGAWKPGHQYQFFINLTAGITCQFDYAAEKVLSGLKMTLSAPLVGTLRRCGKLCWTYLSGASGRDRFTVAICKENGGSNATCDQGRPAEISKITYEVRVEDLTFPSQVLLSVPGSQNR